MLRVADPILEVAHPSQSTDIILIAEATAHYHKEEVGVLTLDPGPDLVPVPEITGGGTPGREVVLHRLIIGEGDTGEGLAVDHRSQIERGIRETE